MFGTLAVAYLFLGGSGAGAIVAASFVDLFRVRERFGVSSRVSIDEASPLERVEAFSLLVGFAALVLGVLCLMFDLGRIDRIVALFLNPSPSFLTAGSFALAALMICGAALAAVRLAYFPFVARPAVVAVEVLAVAVGLFVMLYTGLLLQSLAGVAFWRSPLVPVLFVLSSLSCGIAVMLGAAYFAETDASLASIVRLLVRVDAAVIVLEAVAAAAFAWLALGSLHPSVAASAERLVVGDAAALWWIGFAACGLLVPLVLEVVVGSGRSTGRTVLAAAAVFVLVGGFCLRSSIVEAGTYRNLELEAATEPEASSQGAAAEDGAVDGEASEDDEATGAWTLRLA